MRWEHTDPQTLSLVVGSRKLAFHIPDPKALSEYSKTWDLLRQSNQVLSEAYTSIKMGQAPSYEGMFENVKTLLLEMDKSAREMISHSLHFAGWAKEPERVKGALMGLNLEQLCELTDKFVQAVERIQRGASEPEETTPSEENGAESPVFSGPASPREPSHDPDVHQEKETDEVSPRFTSIRPRTE